MKGDAVCRLSGVCMVVSYLLFFFILMLIQPDQTYAGEEFLADKHKNVHLNCNGCHKENPPSTPVSSSICMGCHGTYKDLAKKTQTVNPNPHESHQGDVDCGKCHKAHKPSVNLCGQCHEFELKVP